MSDLLPPSPTRLRQIALVTKDLQKAEHLLTKVLGTEVVYVDKGVEKWGLHNILVALDGDIIEVVSPFQPNTTAGRLLDKRDDGGYMVIMQTLDAAARRKAIEDSGRAKVIYGYEHDDAVCVQYQPKGIKGGVIPELDSHTPTPSNPTPLSTSHSPWHACGPDYPSYSAAMKRCAHLKLLGVTCRLAPGDTDTDAAARQWEGLFGVKAKQGAGELGFTNGVLKFVAGDKKGKRGEGLERITVGVRGRKRFYSVIREARRLGVVVDEEVRMCGVRWDFKLLEDDGEEGGTERSRL